MFELFESVFPETASRELKSVRVEKPSKEGAEGTLPPGTYEFHELFCTDLECSCERVVFAVLSPDTFDEDVLALIEMDLAPVPLPKRLLGAGKPRLLADPGEADLELDPEDLKYADVLLRLFSEIVAPDTAYIERVRGHQKLFREALQAREETAYPLPDGRPPLDRKAVRALRDLYKETRELGKELANERFLEFEEAGLIPRAAARLGMLSGKKTIVVDSEEEMGILMELAHYGLRSAEGETLVQRFSRARAAEADEPTRRLLSAMREARFGLLQVLSVIPGLGVVARDIWRGESGLLADLTMGSSGEEGAFAIGHYLRLPEFWMGAAGLVQAPRDVALFATRELQNRLRAAGVSSVDALPPHDQEELVAVTLRYIVTGQAPPQPRPRRAERLPGTGGGVGGGTGKKASSGKKRRHRSR